MIGMVLRASYTDIKSRVIENEVTVLGIVAGIIYNGWIFYGGSSWEALGNIGVFVVYTLVFGAAGAYFNVIGGGDVKLLMALSLLIGSPGVHYVVIIASILGALYGMYCLGAKKYKLNERVAFGPFIGIATFIVLLVDFVSKLG